MNYEQTTGRSIQSDFETFHKDNPEVYELFKRYTRQIWNAQIKRGIPRDTVRTSSKLIINRIRWEVEIAGLSGGNSEENVINGIYDEFKINDAFTSRYARLFAEQHPEYAYIFNLRKLRS